MGTLSFLLIQKKKAQHSLDIIVFVWILVLSQDNLILMIKEEKKENGWNRFQIKSIYFSKKIWNVWSFTTKLNPFPTKLYSINPQLYYKYTRCAYDSIRRVGGFDSSHVIAKDDKILFLLLLCQVRNIKIMSTGFLKTGTIRCNAFRTSRQRTCN